MIDLSFILPITRKMEDVFTLLQVLTFGDLSFSKMQKTAAAENLFLPICRARDQTPKRRRTILPSVKATSKIDLKRLYLLYYLIHNVVKKSIITTTTTLFNRVFQKKSEAYQASALWLVWTDPKKTLYWCLVGSAFYVLSFLTHPADHLERERNKYERRIYNDRQHYCHYHHHYHHYHHRVYLKRETNKYEEEIIITIINIIKIIINIFIIIKNILIIITLRGRQTSMRRRSAEAREARKTLVGLWRTCATIIYIIIYYTLYISLQALEQLKFIA